MLGLTIEATAKKSNSKFGIMKKHRIMAHFYANENFPMPIVEELRRLGHDTLTSHESGRSNQSIPDEEVLSFALNEERALLTLNRKHFIQLHKKRPDHAGIIVCSFDADFVALARRIHAAVSSESSLSGRLIRVNRPLLPA